MPSEGADGCPSLQPKKARLDSILVVALSIRPEMLRVDQKQHMIMHTHQEQEHEIWCHGSNTFSNLLQWAALRAITRQTSNREAGSTIQPSQSSGATSWG